MNIFNLFEKKKENTMPIMIGYEVEMCSPLPEPEIRKFFQSNNLPVKEHAVNHNGPYDAWGIARDGSVVPSRPEHFSYELISPVMTLDHSLEIMKLVFDWMHKTESYTNDTTGFHVGVSINNKKDMENLDQLKLALLLDDKPILKQFNRANSPWAKPIQPDILYLIRGRLDYLKNRHDPNLKSDLKEFITSNIPKSKSYSSNLSKLPNYVEFRCMGGKYSVRYDECRDTILYYADCIRAACDPEYLKSEYDNRYKSFLKEIHKSFPDIEKIIEKNSKILEELAERDTTRRNMRLVQVPNSSGSTYNIQINPYSSVVGPALFNYTDAFHNDI